MNYTKYFYLLFIYRSIRELALVSLEKPVYVSVHEKSNTSTPTNLTQVKSIISNNETKTFISFLELYCV